MFNVSLVHCLFFLLCVVTSLLVKCYTIHTYKCLCLVLLCQCSVSILFTVMWLLSVTHAIHYTTSLHCLVCPCTSHTTVPVLHVMYVHKHHANVCSVLHMLIICLDHASSLHTCTVLVYHTYMYTHSIHFSVCGPPCAIICLLLQNGKWLLGASVSHATRDERRFNGYHRGSVSCSEVKAGSEDECY